MPRMHKGNRGFGSSGNRRNPVWRLGFRIASVRVVNDRRFYGPRATGGCETASVGLVARWPVGHTVVADLVHANPPTCDEGDEVLEIIRDETCGLELVAPQEQVAPEGEFAATTRGLGIMRDQDRISIVGVSGHGIVVGTAKSSFDNRPAVVSLVAKDRSDSPSVDILVKDEAHLRNRCQLRLGGLDVLLGQTRERLDDLAVALAGL